MGIIEGVLGQFGGIRESLIHKYSRSVILGESE
jgi:hypothetical protein